ncbi:uncharacterized protein AC631_00638 [Debaryomyces fabryi]|uniref:Uncharacterized protein n=1 Tax=Debaryomyces fabryi TaxID=58627 RepID=A0A0V1Q621_9ASCO|nr:uncharacterized protein AC631_00638 [Debaryomyces fabryi]KSA03663.1 hypothetical protein AC631_00638 [Debaryomyces fabryi]CUM52601.1 unnamed protein product [Debaryomyces fabryi]
MSGFTLPDLRFEESFLKTLYSYAGYQNPAVEDPISPALTEKELNLLSTNVDKQEQQILESPSGPSGLRPIGPISPSIIAYAVFKDQILMPLIQGFLWTGFLISVRPFLGIIVQQGQRCGLWLANTLGLNRIRLSPNPYVYKTTI